MLAPIKTGCAMSKLFFIIIVCWFQCSWLIGQGIVINEVMSKNYGVLLDQDEDDSDWVELFNSSDISIDLSDWGISDESSNPHKWQFPNITMEAQTFLVVFLSGKNSTQSELHSNFSLKSAGESLYLSNADAVIIDLLDTPALQANQSYGRAIDGDSEKLIFSAASPGFTNSANTIEEAIYFSHGAGYYAETIQLQLSNYSQNSAIYYTLDGSTPDTSDFLYQGGIVLESRAGDANYYCTIPSAVENLWKEPSEEIYKCHVLKARSFNNGIPSSQTYTKTYFIDELLSGRFSMPVISISTDETNFFDDTIGIYVPGLIYSGNSGWANYSQSWERPIYLEMFEPDGELVISQQLGARIHGGDSRKFRQKSLRVYARSEYNEKHIEHQVFPDLAWDKYKRLIFKNSLGSFTTTLFADHAAQSMISDIGLATQESRPVILFINGEYWGIHAMIERIDKYYLEQHYSIDTDSINLLVKNPIYNGSILEGSNEEYLALLDFVSDNDLTVTTNYEVVAESINIDNYLDYLISQFYFANNDWPANNIRYWNTTDGNRKWEWMVYDLDGALDYPSYNTLEKKKIAIPPSNYIDEWASFFFRKLFTSSIFQDAFINRFEELLQTTFSYDEVICKINEYESLYEAEFDENNERWQQFESKEEWLNNIQGLRSFAVHRPCVVKSQIKDIYGVTIDIPDCDQSFSIICDSTNISNNTELEELLPFTTFIQDKQLFISIPYSMNHQIRVSDLFGRPILTQEFSDNHIQLNISNWSTGMYVLQVNEASQKIFIP